MSVQRDLVARVFDSAKQITDSRTRCFVDAEIIHYFAETNEPDLLVEAATNFDGVSLADELAASFLCRMRVLGLSELADLVETAVVANLVKENFQADDVISTISQAYAKSGLCDVSFSISTQIRNDFTRLESQLGAVDCVIDKGDPQSAEPLIRELRTQLDLLRGHPDQREIAVDLATLYASAGRMPAALELCQTFDDAPLRAECLAGILRHRRQPLSPQELLLANSMFASPYNAESFPGSIEAVSEGLALLGEFSDARSVATLLKRKRRRDTAFLKIEWLESVENGSGAAAERNSSSPGCSVLVECLLWVLGAPAIRQADGIHAHIEKAVENIFLEDPREIAESQEDMVDLSKCLLSLERFTDAFKSVQLLEAGTLKLQMLVRIALGTAKLEQMELARSAGSAANRVLKSLVKSRPTDYDSAALTLGMAAMWEQLGDSQQAMRFTLDVLEGIRATGRPELRVLFLVAVPAAWYHFAQQLEEGSVDARRATNAELFEQNQDLFEL